MTGNVSSLELMVGPALGSALHRAYLDGAESIAPFFEYDYRSLSSYRAKAEEVDRRFDRKGRLRAARALHPGGDLSPEMLDWVEREGYMVTTGQQPALFGGPLYCLVKALGAVRLAERLETELGRPVIPVYWMASEDHDWAEADHVSITSPKNELVEIRLPRPPGEGNPALGRIPLGSEIAACVARLDDLLPPSEFARDYLDLTARCFTPGRTLPEACLDFFGSLLDRFDLRFVDSASAQVKEASAPLLARELGRSMESEELLGVTGRRLTDLGLPLQVPVLEGAVNLFFEGPAGRERICRDGGGFRLRGSGLRYSSDELLSHQRSDPRTLSPNVLLRPVVESAVFPTLAYVAGPGEVSYFAQLRSYYASLDLTMPVVYPRAGVTPLEGKVAKVLDKFDLAIDGLARPLHEVTAEFVREAVPDRVRDSLSRFRQGVAPGIAEIDRTVRAIDPTVSGSVKHARAQIFHAVRELERKIGHAVKRQNAIAVGQVEKAALHLFPKGVPAERVQSPLYYLARYGESFIDRLYASLEAEIG